MPRIDGLVVARSKIHGYGMIATRRFVAGELIMRSEGVLYSEDDVFDDTYALVLDDDTSDDEDAPNIYYDLVDQSRWINHSCDPNSEVQSDRDADGVLVAYWVALRDIEVGEEISYDYAFVGPLAEPCTCGAGPCRGLIVDPDPDELERIPEHLRDRLRLVIDPADQVDPARQAG